MELSLRKAHALQEKIIEEINLSSIKGAIQITELDSVDEMMTSGLAELNEALEKKLSLFNFLYLIRLRVSEKNIGEINQALAELASIDKLIKLYKDLSSVGQYGLASLNPEQIRKRFELVKERRGTTSSSSAIDTLTVNLISKDMLKSFDDNIRSLKLKKEKIQDKLIELNIRLTITLSDDECDFLKKYNLL